MTKFYAIPGIRLGFVVSHPDSIRKLRERQVPWSVNSFAQKIGTAVLDDIQYELQTHSWLAEEKPWLASRLTEIGMHVFEGSVNYLLFALPQGARPIHVQQVQRELGRRGILIRDASLFAGLDERYARVAVRFREDNERLIRELDRVVKSLMNEAGGEEDV
jgi:threonine-phosphate decarboxylase